MTAAFLAGRCVGRDDFPQTLPVSLPLATSEVRFAGFAHVGSRPWPVVPFHLAQLGDGLTEWFATMHG